MKTFKQHGEGSLEGNLEQKIQKLFQGLFLSILDPAAQDGEGGGKMVFHDVVTLPELGFVTLIIPGQVGDLTYGDQADFFLFIELQECFLEIFLRFRSALLVPVHRQTLSSAKVFAECFLSLKV